MNRRSVVRFAYPIVVGIIFIAILIMSFPTTKTVAGNPQTSENPPPAFVNTSSSLSDDGQ